MPDSVLDVVRQAREAVGSPTLTRESVDAANAAAAQAAVDAQATPDAEAAKPAEEIKETAKPVTFKAAYVSNDGVIYLIGAYAGNVDLDNDVLQTKALVDMSYDFCSSKARTFKANHKNDIAADLVASMPGAPILKSGRVMAYGEDLPEDDPITGICITSEPVAWFVGIRPHDKAIAEKARAGEIIGSSWGAFVDRHEI